MSSGPRALAACLGKTTTPVFRRRGFADGAVVTQWPAIVGAQLAAVTAPERIVYPPRRRNEGTLTLRIASGALALEVQHLQPQLIERINQFFGFRAVTRIRLLHGPVPDQRSPRTVGRRDLSPTEERALAGAVAAVDDVDLAQALENLGRSLLGRTQER